MTPSLPAGIPAAIAPLASRLGPVCTTMRWVGIGGGGGTPACRRSQEAPFFGLRDMRISGSQPVANQACMLESGLRRVSKSLGDVGSEGDVVGWGERRMV